MLRRIMILAGFILIAIAAGWIFPNPVSAQCGVGPSGSCVECHINQQPIDEQDVWHGVHARKDCCTNCHGGNCTADVKDLAHEGLVSRPLEDVYTNCHTCHPEDYWQRAQAFAAELGVTPASRPTPTYIPTPDPDDQESQIGIFVPVNPSSPASETSSFGSIPIGISIAILFFGLGFLVHRAFSQ